MLGEATEATGACPREHARRNPSQTRTEPAPRWRPKVKSSQPPATSAARPGRRRESPTQTAASNHVPAAHERQNEDCRTRTWEPQSVQKE